MSSYDAGALEKAFWGARASKAIRCIGQVGLGTEDMKVHDTLARLTPEICLFYYNRTTKEEKWTLVFEKDRVLKLGFICILPGTFPGMKEDNILETRPCFLFPADLSTFSSTTYTQDTHPFPGYRQCNLPPKAVLNGPATHPPKVARSGETATRVQIRHCSSVERNGDGRCRHWRIVGTWTCPSRKPAVWVLLQSHHKI